DKKVDVITIAHYSIKDKKFNYIPRRLILPLDLKNIPNHVNLIPDFKDADYDRDNKQKYGIPVANGPYGLAYNTRMFKQAPQSWEIFWDPAYKYKYAIGVDEYLYNIKITAMVMGYSKDTLSSFDALNNRKFSDKLRQLTANAGSFWSGIDRPENLLGMSIAMVWGDSITSLKKMGEEWKMADPLEGTIWWIDEYAITWALEEKPLLKKIAEEWINKSLSLDFQINHIFGELKAHPIVTLNTEKLPAKEKKVVENNPGLDFFKGKRILQHAYSQRDNNGLKLMWDKAMEGVPIKREE
ncbi:extracellular solute-binding protein, partial [Desulfobacterales bacterium HSG17]|nr:extracellular solute-binding protein [Desulfobacterales bacterium HSG17]